MSDPREATIREALEAAERAWEREHGPRHPRMLYGKGLQALASLAADARKAALAEAVVEAAAKTVREIDAREWMRTTDCQDSECGYAACELTRAIAAYRDAFPAAVDPQEER